MHNASHRCWYTRHAIVRARGDLSLARTLLFRPLADSAGPSCRCAPRARRFRLLPRRFPLLRRCLAFLAGGRLVLHALRQRCATRLLVPLLVDLGCDFPLDKELGKLAALSLLLNGMALRTPGGDFWFG